MYYSLISSMKRFSFDADAQAFITAAAITDATQQTAINTLVVSLKSYGIWTKMKAVYPMIGGTAASHKFNLKDPRDLNAAFRLTFSGGWTHSSTGAKPNGTNGYADTFIKPQTVSASKNSNGASVYIRTNSEINYAEEFGCWDSSGNFNLFLRYSTNTTQIRIGNAGFIGDIGTTTDSRGFFTATRTSSSIQKLYRNSVILINGTQSVTSAPGANVNMYLSASNLNGTSAEYYSSREQAFASYHDGLTDTEASNFYTAVQAYQTTLGRQV